MARHRDLTGPSAVHQVGFVQSTDPALVAGNGVGPSKVWIDTTDDHNILKIRNLANDGWITVLGPAAASLRLTPSFLQAVYTFESYLAYDLSEMDFVELEYVP